MNIKYIGTTILIVVFISGCMSQESRLERKIKKANIIELESNLYKGTTENFISNKTALNVSIKMAEKHCRDKGLKSYVQDRNLSNDVVYITWACLDKSDTSSLAEKYKNVNFEFIKNTLMTTNNIQQINDHIYSVSLKEPFTSRYSAESIGAKFCQRLKQEHIPQSRFGTQYTFSCIEHSDNSIKRQKAKDKYKQYQLSEENRELIELENRKKRIEEAKIIREERKDRLMNKKLDALLTQPAGPTYVEPSFTPTKTTCTRIFDGRYECKTEKGY